MFKNLIITILLCLLTGCTSAPVVPDDLDAMLEEAVFSLTTDVSDIISRVNNISSDSISQEKHRTLYLEIKQQISDIDTRIDDLEDTVEKNYHNSYISQELYSKLLRELEILEELMDSTEEHCFFD